MDNKGYSEVILITKNLLNWVKNEDFRGWDPYDGLNSFLWEILPIKNKYTGIVITQFFKRFPVNLRPIFGIKKMRNAKGIALFIKGLLNLYRKTGGSGFIELARNLSDWLLENTSPFTQRYAWGYNFPWQSRNSFKPAFYPNVVTTVFCADALLSMYEETGCNRFIEPAISSGDFIIKELNKHEDRRGVCFSYSPRDEERVYNATLLASMLLFHLWKLTGREDFLEYAFRSTFFAVNSQNEDGSWFYGDADNQKWIDNFHTGYNLWALNYINKNIDERMFKVSFDKGFKYFLDNLFTYDGMPKNTCNSLYPMDIHSFAVSSIVMGMVGYTERQGLILGKAIDLFYSGKGYFYFWRTPRYTIKIPYMRWSNAWMFLALTEFLTLNNLT